MNDKDLTPFLDVRQNQLQLEVATGDSIDTKALAVLASDFALLLFIAQPSGHIPSVLALISSLFLGGAIVLTCVAIRPKGYAGASASALERPEYLEFKDVKLVKQLISDTEAALATNEAINKKRWLMCVIALIITLVTTAILLFEITY